MIIYFLVFVVICIGFCYPRNPYVKLIIIFILCTLVFCRDKTVGTDVISYSANFKKITDNPGTWNFYLPFEPGFNYYILYFKKYVSTNPLDCWGVIGILYVFAFTKFSNIYTKNKNIALALFVLFGTFYLSFNIMRQCFAFTIILYILSGFNLYRLNIKSIILVSIYIVVCGILFHPTMYICLCLLLYYIPQIQNRMTRINIILLLVVSFICFITQIIIPILIGFLEQILIEGKLINYATKNIQSGVDSGFSSAKALLITLFQIYITYISKETKNVFLYMSTLGVLFLNIFVPLVLEFARVYELFVVFQIIYLSQLWSSINPHTIKGKIYRLSLVAYSFTLYFNILIKNYGEIVPYQFRF